MIQRLATLTTFAAALLGLAVSIVPLGGCSNIERLPPSPETPRADLSGFSANVPRIMRGTIESETVIDGYRPVLVRGYGLVVGLPGTGSTTMPPDLQTHMLQEMERRGVGLQGSGMGNIDPTRMLAATDTAVVIVEGFLPPGAVGRKNRGGVSLPGTPFDVRVYLDPRTDATSLDGGRLYTCELRPANQGELLPPTGSQQARVLAKARGEVFVNPFAEPTEAERDVIDRTRGRILNGGEATHDNPIKLRLRTPSHARAEIIQRSINTRFPQEPGQSDPTARGESGEAIQITVPTSHRGDPERFVSLLQHMTIRQANPEAVASRIKSIVRQDPSYANAASLRWQALGRKALPMIRDMYDAPEVPARLAALTAGANLRDALVVPPLLEMLEVDDADARRQSVALLRDVGVDPKVDIALHDLLNDDDVEIRLTAYEALNSRNSLLLDRYEIGGNFLLDVVDSTYPMIYVAQVGRPRIVLFGSATEVSRPLLADIWSGRLIMKSNPYDEEIEIYYRPGTGRAAMQHRASPYLVDLIRMMGRDLSPTEFEPGLGLSYAETIGVLYAMRKQGAVSLDFQAELDRVQQAILRMLDEEPPQGDRPEFEPSAEEVEATEAANAAARDEFGRPVFTAPSDALDAPAVGGGSGSRGGR